LKVEDRDSLEDNLADKVTGDGFVLFWGATALLAEKALSCFQE